MSLRREDFAEFYGVVNHGHSPFAWQERLLDHLLDHAYWPDRIAAPTGAGKTSAIDVHVFAVALTTSDGDHAGLRLPRRLAMVVDRRVLVDDQHERAIQLADKLDKASPHSTHGGANAVVTAVARSLTAMRWPADELRDPAARDDGSGSPLLVARLRGGTMPSRLWRDYPTACAVLCATPDMWGSRLLFGGYGTSRLAAPREAGLLAFDSAVVVDEAHLSRQLLVTARRVAHLASVAEQPLQAVPALQVVETTATPASSADTAVPVRTIGVELDDLDEPLLADRLTRSKPVTLLPVPGWPSGKRTRPTAEALARAVREMLDLPAEGGEWSDQELVHTVGCFVNSVPMAVAVADALRSRHASEPALRVVLVCGQTRPADLDRLTQRYPRLLTPAGNRDVDVIVTTQSLEVGVDLDLAGIVTELASGSALAQRAGRANRRGWRASAPVVVAVPAEPITDKTWSGPYQNDELADALRWITGRADDPDGLAPWAQRKAPPPAARARRVLLQRPELADGWHWARTSDDLAAEPELDLWLAESFDDDTAIGVVVRDAIPTDADRAIELIRDLPPRPHEVFSVPYRTAQLALTPPDDNPPDPDVIRPPMLRVRGEDIVVLEWRTTAGRSIPRFRPGDLVVVDSIVEVFSDRASGDGFSPQVVVATDVDDATDGVAPSQRGRTDDVLHALAVRGNAQGNVALRLELATGPGSKVGGLDCARAPVAVKELATSLAESAAEALEDRRSQPRVAREQRLALADFLDTLLKAPGATDGARGMVEAAGLLLRRRPKDSDLIVHDDGDGVAVRVIVVDHRHAGADEELRQVFTTRDPDEGPLTLAAHQAAVAARAELLARRLGLSDVLATALQVAGVHHDDGKADPRFQIRLGAQTGDGVLAKSDPTSTARQVRDRERLTGLPRGWRHEQLSALHYLADQSDSQHRTQVDRALVARLVGTSHGHGRSGFPHSADELLDAEAGSTPRSEAAILFDRGRWDELIERTQLRYGVWGCAYLEALLRAADGQVSGEGS